MTQLRFPWLRHLFIFGTHGCTGMRARTADFNRVARRRAVREGDAVLLTVAIYLDILNLFLSLLRLLRTFR